MRLRGCSLMWPHAIQQYRCERDDVNNLGVGCGRTVLFCHQSVNCAAAHGWSFCRRCARQHSTHTPAILASFVAGLEGERGGEASWRRKLSFKPGKHSASAPATMSSTPPPATTPILAATATI